MFYLEKPFEGQSLFVQTVLTLVCVCLCTFSTVAFLMSCLFVCRLFVEILNSCMDCDEIQFKEDGSWAPMRSKKEVQEVSSASCNNGLDGETTYFLWLLLCDSSEITLAVIKIGLKTNAKKRENTQPLPSLFIYSQF